MELKNKKYCNLYQRLMEISAFEERAWRNYIEEADVFVLEQSVADFEACVTDCEELATQSRQIPRDATEEERLSSSQLRATADEIKEYCLISSSILRLSYSQDQLNSEISSYIPQLSPQDGKTGNNDVVSLENLMDMFSQILLDFKSLKSRIHTSFSHIVSNRYDSVQLSGMEAYTHGFNYFHRLAQSIYTLTSSIRHAIDVTLAGTYIVDQHAIEDFLGNPCAGELPSCIKVREHFFVNIGTLLRWANDLGILVSFLHKFATQIVADIVRPLVMGLHIPIDQESFNTQIIRYFRPVRAEHQPCNQNESAGYVDFHLYFEPSVMDPGTAISEPSVEKSPTTSAFAAEIAEYTNRTSSAVSSEGDAADERIKYYKTSLINPITSIFEFANVHLFNEFSKEFAAILWEILIGFLRVQTIKLDSTIPYLGTLPNGVCSSLTWEVKSTNALPMGYELSFDSAIDDSDSAYNSLTTKLLEKTHELMDYRSLLQDNIKLVRASDDMAWAHKGMSADRLLQGGSDKGKSERISILRDLDLASASNGFRWSVIKKTNKDAKIPCTCSDGSATSYLDCPVTLSSADIDSTLYQGNMKIRATTVSVLLGLIDLCDLLRGQWAKGEDITGNIKLISCILNVILSRTRMAPLYSQTKVTRENQTFTDANGDTSLSLKSADRLNGDRRLNRSTNSSTAEVTESLEFIKEEHILWKESNYVDLCKINVTYAGVIYNESVFIAINLLRWLHSFEYIVADEVSYKCAAQWFSLVKCLENLLLNGRIILATQIQFYKLQMERELDKPIALLRGADDRKLVDVCVKIEKYISRKLRTLHMLTEDWKNILSTHLNTALSAYMENIFLRKILLGLYEWVIKEKQKPYGPQGYPKHWGDNERLQDELAKLLIGLMKNSKDACAEEGGTFYGSLLVSLCTYIQRGKWAWNGVVDEEVTKIQALMVLRKQ